MDVNSEHYLIQKICRAAMRCLLIQLNQHDTLHLKPIGMENKLTSPLSRLNPRVQEILISNAYHFIDFSIDSNVLEKTMQQAEINQSNYEFLRVGSFIHTHKPKDLTY